MKWKTLDTDLSAIDINNRSFQITTDQTLEPLIASIGVLGLLNPPFILPTESRQFMVVSGFKRVAACRHLGHTTIEARVLNPDTTREHLAETAICENMSQRPLNLVETSRALNLLSGQVREPSSFATICRRLGLPEHSSMQDKIAPICRMPAAIQEGILEESISHTTALMLDKMAPETSTLLAGMFRDLHLSHGKQREILINIDDIVRREGIDANVILKDATLLALLSDPETDRVQKSNMVRSYFRSKRFPLLTRTEETFQKELKKLTLGNNIRFQAPSGFESPEFVFTLGIKNLEDLVSGIKHLQNSLNNPAMQKILSLKTTLS
jgi:ParB family chromosome partitioning protein